MSHKPAGLRTQTLVWLRSRPSNFLRREASERVEIGRIAANVITGLVSSGLGSSSHRGSVRTDDRGAHLGQRLAGGGGRA